MPKHTRGIRTTKDGPIVLKTSEHRSMRKIRCPNCHGMAVPSQRSDGTKVMRCDGVCGTEFTSTRM